MNYPPLIPSCKKAIEEGKCLGCTALENLQFLGNINCEYSKKFKPVENEGLESRQLKWNI
jgi:hypothetical protein